MKMKSLFLKSMYNMKGPYKSFNYTETSDEEILSTFLGKSGHPFQLILLLEADIKIIKESVPVYWQQQMFQEYPDMKWIIEKYTKGICSVYDIDFSQYDLVYCEDPIIPPQVMKKHKYTLFIYFASEHWGSKTPYAMSYDVFFQHVSCMEKQHHNENAIIYPNCSVKLQNMFDANKKDGYFLETKDMKRNISISVDIPNHNTSSVMKNYMYLSPEDPKESMMFYENIARSRYAVSISKWYGQFFIYAASLECICIGDIQPMNFPIVHPDMVCDCAQEVAIRIKKLEQDIAYREMIISWQNNVLSSANKRFINIIEKNLSRKRVLQKVKLYSAWLYLSIGVYKLYVMFRSVINTIKKVPFYWKRCKQRSIKGNIKAIIGVLLKKTIILLFWMY